MSAINPCNPCLKKNSSLLALFLNLLKVSLFAYQPDDIAFFEYSGRQNTGQVLPALFQSYHHTVVFIPYSAFYQCLSQEFAAAADDELAKFHLALFYFSFLRQQVALQGGVEFLQLVVVADYLQFVAREDDHVAVRDVQPVRAAVNAAQVYTDCYLQALQIR